MLIRQEAKQDYDNIYKLVQQAFASAEHSDGAEQDLVIALRASKDFVPPLALVAECGGQIVGHILFTTAKVASDTVLVLAPLSVLPKMQKTGIGTALVKKAHTIAKQMGYEYILVLGSSIYYPRFGYLPAQSFGITVPGGIPSENFMAIKLTPAAKQISGKVFYAKEFGI